MKQIEKKQRGFTLIEFMVVIALIGLGLVLVVTQFGQATASNKTQTSVRNISALISGITSLKDVRNGYSGLTTGVLLQTNAVPENMKGTANQITNVFGDKVLVSSPTNDSFKMEILGVPQEACTEIAAKLLGAMNSSITDIQAKAQAALGTATVTGTADAITTLGTAQSKCISATAPNISTLVLLGK